MHVVYLRNRKIGGHSMRVKKSQLRILALVLVIFLLLDSLNSHMFIQSYAMDTAGDIRAGEEASEVIKYVSGGWKCKGKVDVHFSLHGDNIGKYNGKVIFLMDNTIADRNIWTEGNTDKELKFGYNFKDPFGGEFTDAKKQ